VPAKKKQQPSGPRIVEAPPDRTRRYHALAIAALLLISFAAYSNSFSGELIFDNGAVIGADPRIRAATTENLALIFTKEYWYPQNTSGLYRPLSTLSYLVNYSVLGDRTDTPGYHVVNLALHDLNIILAFALGLILFDEPLAAFALAALWSVHPLLVESVTNIVGRADLLAAFGVLAGLLCHIRQARSTGSQRALWLIALVLAQTIGLFSKESGAILPAILLLYDLIWRRTQSRRDRVIPYLALAAPFALYFYLRSHVDTHLEVRFTENALAGATFLTARLTAIKVIGKFLWLFLWPASLSADYSYNAIPLFAGHFTDWEDWKTIIALVSSAALIALAIRFRDRKPLLFFTGFFFIALAPSSNLLFLIGTIMAERFMYLPALALCGCLIVAVREIPAKPRVKYTALAVVTLALAARTYARNADWRDAVSLWSSTIAASPGSARAHNNLGVSFAKRSESDSAIAQFETAVRILPSYTYAHISLGNEFARNPARLNQAVEQFEAAIKLDPSIADAHYNLGNVLARIPGRTADAITEWQTAIRLKPDMAEAHYNLATVYTQTGRLAGAIPEFQAAIRIKPDYADAYNNLAGVYAQLPDHLADAVTQYQSALRIEPANAATHNNLGNALSRIPGRLPEAIAQFQEAIRLNPNFGEAHYRLGMALLQIGRPQDAIDELESAYRLNPDPQGRRMIDELRARVR
jgi:protein O-mannosyl-transferase